MTARDFAFWLQGFFELSGHTRLDADQVKMVRNHLNLVFIHDIDPTVPGDPTKLQAVHDGKIDATDEEFIKIGGPTVNGMTPRC